MVGKLKGGRRSISRRSRRHRHGTVGDAVEIAREATNPYQTDGSKDGASSGLPNQPPTIDSSRRTILSNTQPTATEEPVHSPQRTNRAVRRDTPVPYVSIFDPLNTPAFKPISRSKKPPKWTSHQLSSVAETVSQHNLPTQLVDSPPSREVQGQLPETAAAEQPPVAFHDKSGVVAKKRKKGSRDQRQLTVSFARDSRELPLLKSGGQPDARKKIKGRKATPIPPSFVRKEPPPYPYFQSARRPIVPAVESSWSNSKISPGLFPYVETTNGQAKPSHPSVLPPGCPAVKQRHRATPVQPQPQSRAISSFGPVEDLDRHRDGKGGDADATTANNAVAAADSCPCCGEAVITGSPTVDGMNGQKYHVECFVCRICGRPVDAKGTLDDCLFLMQSPHHPMCVYEKVGPVIVKQRQRSLARRQHQHQQRKAHHQQQQQQQQQEKPSSMPAVAANPQKSRVSAAVALEQSLRTQKALTRELSAFFSARKKPRPPPPPPVMATATATATEGGCSEPSCAGCGKGFASSLEEHRQGQQEHDPHEPPSPEGGVVAGPGLTRFHRACMRCRRCGVKMAQGGARWYEWDAEGLM
ncbi:hypothetical protein GP486_001763, partial [Trichoglossum hirsutum]